MNMNFMSRNRIANTPIANPCQEQPPLGMMTEEELNRPNEASVGGRSSLMNLAVNLTKNVEAAERQHAQSLQEVIDAQTAALTKFTTSLDLAKDKLRMAAEIAVEAQKDMDAAVRTMIDDSIDTNQMVSKLRDIRIKSPLLDKGTAIAKASNQPRKTNKRG
jgi:hypothetical protein